MIWLIGLIAKKFNLSSILAEVIVYGGIAIIASGTLWALKHKYDTGVIDDYKAEQTKLGNKIHAGQQKEFGNNLTEYIAGVQEDEQIAPLVDHALDAICVRLVPGTAAPAGAGVPAPPGRAAAADAGTADGQLLEKTKADLRSCRAWRRKHNRLVKDAIAAGAQKD